MAKQAMISLQGMADKGYFWLTVILCFSRSFMIIPFHSVLCLLNEFIYLFILFIHTSKPEEATFMLWNILSPKTYIFIYFFKWLCKLRAVLSSIYIYFLLLLVSHLRLSQLRDDTALGWLKPFWCLNTLPATALWLPTT